MKETKSEPFLVLLALLCAIFHLIPIWMNLNVNLWHYSCNMDMIYIGIIKGERNEIRAFFSPLGASWPYIPFQSNLDESEQNFLALLM